MGERCEREWRGSIENGIGDGEISQRGNEGIGLKS